MDRQENRTHSQEILGVYRWLQEEPGAVWADTKSSFRVHKDGKVYFLINDRVVYLGKASQWEEK